MRYAGMENEGDADWPELCVRLRHLAGNERHVLVELLLLLGRVDHDRLYLPLGYASTCEFLRRSLGLSERMTFYRIASARVLFRFPHAAELLRNAKLCMTTMASLASVLTEENASAILQNAVGKSKVQIAAMRVRLDPRPLPRDVVRAFAATKDDREVEAADVLTPGKVNPTACKEILATTWLRRHMNTDGGSKTSFGVCAWLTAIRCRGPLRWRF